ncbi:MAG: hypothetical protein Q9226_009252, partial [Calogaya cf. arnoldii]
AWVDRMVMGVMEATVTEAMDMVVMGMVGMVGMAATKKVMKKEVTKKALALARMVAVVMMVVEVNDSAMWRQWSGSSQRGIDDS